MEYWKEQISIDDFKVGALCGWHRKEAYGWFEPVIAPAKLAEIEIRSARSNGILERKPNSIPHAQFQELREGIWVLKLSGTNSERGYAHGRLLANEILDFFEFFCLEMVLRSAQVYEKFFIVHHRENVVRPDWYEKEISGVIAGMKDSGVSLYIPLLERDFGIDDLHFLNTFVEVRSAGDVKKNSEISCSQFSFWGNTTKGGDVDGGIIAGRNMDNEIDMRKVTVTHFIAFAHEPVNDGERRFLSFMWPGWVNTYTGVNEDGVYCCINAGSMGSGPVVGNIVPIGCIQRSVLSRPVPLSTKNITDLMEHHKCEGNGTLASGGIMFFASPNINGEEGAFGAFLYEGDAYGGAIREAGERRPNSKEVIMATNHFLKYGFESSELSDMSNPVVFGGRITHPTAWRFKVGMDTLEAWLRAGQPLGTPEMVRLLQTVTQATEHSIMMRVKGDGGVEVEVSNGHLQPSKLWDAPYQPWRSFPFAEAFN
eukprot:TRINITY_DN1697_c1_g1_i1.p1 TRINITY_DN1697_c1_g1~~TRINITY_DN1697_c1_g1_i1.p1  ORF type:complete len:482 (-),score=94.07 TRINITY_DN1697_c1_g1_i1:74-1519(-)